MIGRNFVPAAVLCIKLLTLAGFCLSAGGCHWIKLVNVSSLGEQGNDRVYSADLSSNGRYVTFSSPATNHVEGDTNFKSDVFVHDLQTGIVTRISVDSSGNEGNNASHSPSISGEGRYVAFHSYATNLVEGDTTSLPDVIVRDGQTGVLTIVSVSSAGIQANQASFAPKISRSGQFVLFESAATNLVAGDTGSYNDLFVHDRQTGITTRVSVDSEGNEANGASSNGGSSHKAISDDGRYVAFGSLASNLVPNDTSLDDVFVHDRLTGSTKRVSIDSDGNDGGTGSHSYLSSMSGDGRYIAFFTSTAFVSDDTNNEFDVYLHDTLTGSTTRVSVDSGGQQGNGYSGHGILSADGRFVLFRSSADNLVHGDTNGVSDIFVHDRNTGTTNRISTDHSGIEGNDHSSGAYSISADGRYALFTSKATNLISSDTGGIYNAYVKAVPVIEIDALSPDHLPIGATTSVTIHGAGFIPGVKPWFNRGALTNIVIVDENTITADFTIPANGLSGAYDMGVNWNGDAAGPGIGTGVAAKCGRCVTLQ